MINSKEAVNGSDITGAKDGSTYIKGNVEITAAFELRKK